MIYFTDLGYSNLFIQDENTYKYFMNCNLKEVYQKPFHLNYKQTVYILYGI